jgi:hypothetical protein
MSSQLRNPFQNSSDLALQFSALSKIKYGLKKQIFADIPDIQRNVMLLRGILQNDFQGCFRQWHHRLSKCRGSQGKYLAGDSSR